MVKFFKGELVNFLVERFKGHTKLCLIRDSNSKYPLKNVSWGFYVVKGKVFELVFSTFPNLYFHRQIYVKRTYCVLIVVAKFQGLKRPSENLKHIQAKTRLKICT
jgi:hypothetical protein